MESSQTTNKRVQQPTKTRKVKPLKGVDLSELNLLIEKKKHLTDK